MNQPTVADNQEPLFSTLFWLLSCFFSALPLSNYPKYLHFPFFFIQYGNTTQELLQTIIMAIPSTTPTSPFLCYHVILSIYRFNSSHQHNKRIPNSFVTFSPITTKSNSLTVTWLKKKIEVI